MKRYEIYVYDNGEFQLATKTAFSSFVNEYLNKKENEHKFFRVDDYTLHETGKKKGQEVMQSSSLYLNGYQIGKHYRICTEEDLTKMQKKLTTLYKVDGTVRYYPNVPLSIPDIRDILGLNENEWATEKCVKDKPRYYALFYDWESYDCTREKVLNKTATKRFKTELYGDVLFVNDNFVS